MAGAFLGANLNPYDPQLSMVRGAGVGNSPVPVPSYQSFGAPTTQAPASASTTWATNSYAPQPFQAQAPAPVAPSTPSSSILDAINAAYDAQSKLAAEAAGLQWEEDAAARGLMSADQAGQGLRATLVGKAMNPIAAARANSIASAMMDQQRMDQQQRQWEQEMAMRQAEFNARQQSVSQAMGGSYSTGGGSYSAPTAPAPSRSGGSAGEQLAYDYGFMDSAGAGSGGRSAGFEGPQGVPGLTPGVGGVSHIFGSPNFDSFTQGFGQRNGGFGNDSGVFRQPGQSYSGAQMQYDRSQTTFSGGGATGAPIPGGASLLPGQYTGTGQSVAGPLTSDPLVSGSVRADSFNNPQTYAAATGYTPYGQRSPYAVATGR